MNIENYKTIAATEAHQNTSDRYAFIPTKRVLNVMADYGWMPSKVIETNSRKDENKGFQKHMVRLMPQSTELSLGTERAEIVVVNSHMGTSAFSLMLGIYRLICSNGLIVGETYNQHKVRHVGYTDDAVADAIKAITEQAQVVLPTINQWKNIELNRNEALALSESTLELVKGDDTKWAYNPEHLLRARRYDDSAKTDLWTTFNTIQENVMKGGIQRRTTTGQRRRTSEIKNIDKNVHLNRALWTLAEKMAAIKATA